MRILKCIYIIIKSCLSNKVIFLLIIFTGATHICAQEIKTTNTIVQESSLYNLQQAQSDTYLKILELVEKEKNNIELYVPSSEQQSIPEDADWIFEVPVDVKNISPLVEELVINIGVIGNDEENSIFGYKSTRIELVNGAFTGNLIIGVNYDSNTMEDKYGYHLPPHEAKQYLIMLFLKNGDDIFWPVKTQASPTWRMAAANEPLISFTREDLPEGYNGEE